MVWRTKEEIKLLRKYKDQKHVVIEKTSDPSEIVLTNDESIYVWIYDNDVPLITDNLKKITVIYSWVQWKEPLSYVKVVVKGLTDRTHFQTEIILSS